MVVTALSHPTVVDYLICLNLYDDYFYYFAIFVLFNMSFLATFTHVFLHHYSGINPYEGVRPESRGGCHGETN